LRSRRFLFIGILLSLICQGCSQLEPLVTGSRIKSGEIDKLPYNILTVKTDSAQPQQKFPLLLVLHGTGMDGEAYLEQWEEEAGRHHVMVVSPSRQKNYVNEEKSLGIFYRLIDELSAKYPVDRRRIYIAGVSSGALIARWLVVQRPHLWKAAIFMASEPFEDWMHHTDVSKLPPVLYLHGGQDPVFPAEKIREKAELLRRLGARADLLIDPEAGHEHRPEWNKIIFQWIQNQEK